MTQRIVARSRRPAGTCHKLVAAAAREIATAAYEVLAYDNDFYKLNPSQIQFVALCWPKFVEDARKAMAASLAGSVLSEDLKETVKDALIEDARYKVGRDMAGIGAKFTDTRKFIN